MNAFPKSINCAITFSIIWNNSIGKVQVLWTLKIETIISGFAVRNIVCRMDILPLFIKKNNLVVVYRNSFRAQITLFSHF